MFQTLTKEVLLQGRENVQQAVGKMERHALHEGILLAEKNIAMIRLLVIGFATFSVFLAPGHDTIAGSSMPLLVAMALFMWAYGGIMLFFKPYERYSTFSSGLVGAALDAIFSLAWLCVTGGIHSPYFVLFYVAVIGFGYRFNLPTTMITASLYAAGYISLIAILHQMGGNIGVVVVRSGFIFILGYAGNVITRETREQVQRRLETEALAIQAHRAEEELRQLNLQLEEKIQERTRALESSVNQLETMVEAIPMMAWTALPDGNINYCNKPWYDFTGADDLHGWNWEKYIYPPDHERTKSRWLYSIRTGRHFEIEYRWVRHDGEVRWMLGRANPILGDNGKPILWIGSATDIHDQKTAEQQLEKRVAARTRALLESNRELQRSNEDLEQFAYVASHDLKEPLRMIASYSQLLLMKVDRKDPEAREFAGFVESGIGRMKTLINDLLNYSRIGREEIYFSEVDLNTLMQQVKESLLLKITETGTDLVFEGLPVIRGNNVLLKQLFQNLLDNALKFRKQEAAPQVHVCAERKENQWLISVRDNGIGISKDYHNRIFVIFQRLHTADKYPGTGIGLAICKKIVEQHKGEIWVESEAGEGTTFNFTLPG